MVDPSRDHGPHMHSARGTAQDLASSQASDRTDPLTRVGSERPEGETKGEREMGKE